MIALCTVLVQVTSSILTLAVEDFLGDKQKNVLLIDRLILLMYVCVLSACSVPGPEAAGP